MIKSAKRNRDAMDIVPLFYDANKAPPEIISLESLYGGLKRAHDFSGIGEVSNAITKLWNKDVPNPNAAKLLTMYNNYVIDAAKTGFVNSYEDHPEAKRLVNKAVGSKTSRLPYFFQFSRNGRHGTGDIMRKAKKRNYLKPNKSTMNRIAKKFSDIGRINMNMAGIRPFNINMLMPGKLDIVNETAVKIFCDMDDSNMANLIESRTENDISERENIKSYEILAEDIVDELTERFGSLSIVYPSIVRRLFSGENFRKQTHKQMFWRVFGDIACRMIERNLASCKECDSCHMLIPEWDDTHECSGVPTGFFRCSDCGVILHRTNSRQKRCPECQAKSRTRANTERMKKKRAEAS